MAKKISVIGIGGIGSWLSHGLARILEYADPGSVLVLVDGDHFEPKNKERQAFREMGNKAEVLAAELMPLFPSTIIIPRPQWVVSTIEDGSDENESKIIASALLEEDDHVFCVVDNFAARALVFDTARKYQNIDIYTGGNDEAYFGGYYHYQRRGGLDVTDHPAVWHPEYEDPPDRNPGAMSCQERSMLESGTQFIATNMMVAAALLARANQVFRGAQAVPRSEFFFDLEAGLASAFDRDAADGLVTEGAR